MFVLPFPPLLLLLPPFPLLLLLPLLPLLPLLVGEGLGAGEGSGDGVGVGITVVDFITAANEILTTTAVPVLPPAITMP